MGGGGAFLLAANFARTYGAIYALSAGKMGFASFPIFTDSQWRQFLTLASMPGPRPGISSALSLAAAYSPNPGKPPRFVDWPVELQGDEVRTVDAVLLRWIALDPITAVQKNAGNLRQLRAIHFSCGTEDKLLGPNRLMRDVLTKLGLKFTYEEYPGAHNDKIREQIEKRVLPMFSETLVFQ